MGKGDLVRKYLNFRRELFNAENCVENQILEPEICHFEAAYFIVVRITLIFNSSFVSLIGDDSNNPLMLDTLSLSSVILVKR